MMRSLLPAAVLFALLPLHAFAQTEASCLDDVMVRLSEEQAEFRRAVYGSTGSSFTVEGVSIDRTGGSSPAPNRVAIFGTKGRMTSELVEPLLDSYRTYRCESVSLCELLRASLRTKDTSAPITVHPLGCEKRTLPPMSACTLGSDAEQRQIAGLQNFCERTVEESLAFERASLKLAVGYDSGYRSLLQFVGMFDAFLKDVPTRTFTALRQMAGLLGRLHQIPCFLTHCDQPPVL